MVLYGNRRKLEDKILVKLSKTSQVNLKSKVMRRDTFGYSSESNANR